MSDITQARRAVIERILHGQGRSSQSLRKAAFDQQGVPERLQALVEKIAKHAYKVTDEDVAAAKASGMSEDELFEIAVCTAIGQASRQYESALAALDAATNER